MQRASVEMEITKDDNPNDGNEIFSGDKTVPIHHILFLPFCRRIDFNARFKIIVGQLPLLS